MSKKPDQQPERPEHAPVNVEIPPQIQQRMEAIVNLSRAILACSNALTSPAARITVSHCSFTASEGSTGPLVSIGATSFDDKPKANVEAGK